MRRIVVGVKRGMVGGAHRGPVAIGRQRRTIRLVQILLLLIAAGLLMFSGYSLGRSDGIEVGRERSELDPPSQPSAMQTIASSVLGLAAAGAAVALQSERGVRLMTPRRLRELDEGEAPRPLEDEREPSESRH